MGRSPIATSSPAFAVGSGFGVPLVVLVVALQLCVSGVDARAFGAGESPSRRSLSAVKKPSDAVEEALRAQLGGSGSISSEVSELLAAAAAENGWEGVSNSASSALDEIISALTAPAATGSSCSNGEHLLGTYYFGVAVGQSCDEVCEGYGGTCNSEPMSKICDAQAFKEAAEGATAVVDGIMRDYVFSREVTLDSLAESPLTESNEDPTGPGVSWTSSSAARITVPSSPSVTTCDAASMSVGRLCSCDVTEESAACPEDHSGPPDVSYHMASTGGMSCDDVCGHHDLACEAEHMNNICNRFAFQDVATADVLQSAYPGAEAQTVVDTMASGDWTFGSFVSDAAPMIILGGAGQPPVVALAADSSGTCGASRPNVLRMCSCAPWV